MTVDIYIGMSYSAYDCVAAVAYTMVRHDNGALVQTVANKVKADNAQNVELRSIKAAVQALEYTRYVDIAIIHTDNAYLYQFLIASKKPPAKIGRQIADIRRRAAVLQCTITWACSCSDDIEPANQLARAAQSKNYKPPTPEQYALWRGQS